MSEFQAVLSHPVVVGTITGFVGAARVDYLAFQNAKSLDEMLAYSWKVALWRWFQGAVGGAVVARELDFGA